MKDLLVEEIDGVSIYFSSDKPVKEFYAGRHVVFEEKDTGVYYYVREKPGHVKTGTKYASLYEFENEVPELTEYFSITEEIFKGTVLKGKKLMVLIKGPEINYIKAIVLSEDNWKDSDLFIGMVTPKGMGGRPMAKSYMFRTSKATLVKDDN